MADTREYRSGDYSAVREILIATGLYRDSMDTSEALDLMVKQDPDAVLVAEISDRVVGCAYFLYNPFAPLLFRLAVNPDFQGRGIGEQLYREVKQSARARGLNTLHFLVDETSQDIQTWYVKRGARRGHTYRWMVADLSN